MRYSGSMVLIYKVSMHKIHLSWLARHYSDLQNPHTVVPSSATLNFISITTANWPWAIAFVDFTFPVLHAVELQAMEGGAFNTCT